MSRSSSRGPAQATALHGATPPGLKDPIAARHPRVVGPANSPSQGHTHPGFTAHKDHKIVAFRREDPAPVTPRPQHCRVYHDHGASPRAVTTATPSTTPLRDNGTARGGSTGTYKGRADSMR